MAQIVVTKGRTTKLRVSLGYDVSGDTITSEIRVGRNKDTPLIVAWDVDFKTDGTDGELILTIDDSASEPILDEFGFMDFKRVSDGEPFSIIDDPIEVVFREPITS